MKVIRNIKEWKYAPLRYWDWSFADKLRNDITLYYGFNTAFNLDKVTSTGGLNVFIDLESPNQLLAKTKEHRESVLLKEERFDKILAINPYICEARNKILGTEKYIYVFYPTMNKKYIPQDFNKIYDMYYAGHVSQNFGLFKDFYDVISETPNHVVVGGGQGEGNKKLNLKPVNFTDKIKLSSESKVSLTHDLIMIQEGRLQFSKEGTANHIPRGTNSYNENYWVQHKSRIYEAFFSKSLALHYKDNFRIMEEFCTPDEHFIYFDNKQDFKQKLTNILDNPKIYQEMVEHTYQYAINNFTVEAFFDRYLKNL